MDKLFQIEPLEEFSSVTRKLLNNLYQSEHDLSIDIESNVINSAKENLKDIISKSNFNMDKVKETLQSNLWDRDKTIYFISLLEEKQSELLYSALNHQNCLYGETIIHFDWILKLVFGTHELKSLRFPLLQLIFSTSNCKNDQMKTYDLTKEMVQRMIHALEDITEA